MARAFRERLISEISCSRESVAPVPAHELKVVHNDQPPRSPALVREHAFEPAGDLARISNTPQGWSVVDVNGGFIELGRGGGDDNKILRPHPPGADIAQVQSAPLHRADAV